MGMVSTYILIYLKKTRRCRQIYISSIDLFYGWAYISDFGILWMWIVAVGTSRINIKFWIKENWVVATQIFFMFNPKIGEDEPNLTSIFFKLGWFNHQAEKCLSQVIQPWPVTKLHPVPWRSRFSPLKDHHPKRVSKNCHELTVVWSIYLHVPLKKVWTNM